MARKLRILFVTFEDTGVGLYRIVQPAEQIRKQGLAEVRMCRFTGTGKNHIDLYKIVRDPREMHVWQEAAKWADIVYFTKTYLREQYVLIRLLKDYKREQKAGNLITVMDMDDNVYNVNPDNPGAGAYDEGQSEARKNVDLSIFSIDGLVLSVDPLKKLYTDKKMDFPMYVNPNGIDFRFFKHKKKDFKRKRKLRIGFAGASGHREDLKILDPVMEMLRWNHDFEFITVGQAYGHKFVDDNIGFVKLPDYPKVLAKAAFDIGVAPLRDNLYNRCKSNLRLLEYSALRIPTVCSKIVTYQAPSNTIQCTDDADEWVKALSSLLEDARKRRELAESAYREVKENFNVVDQAAPLVKFLKSI